mmetsp:Transcript_11518/g.9960  ORF Transcript_11518/g.9960 Transcript_11518/m.9960 type:complete len:115 (-) Transcript_11518:565-909(-)|eukprot:CAMPEP_0114581666 /NCGR_PEP_ID=MMETSP0125-20121206/5753_1 /TAXON_ID=485358 ORGANISM="Aristerostoma sp., Strain ATCC 50986" /NCGR_SAMPLE_ID=MMETSP0125 /ASSEMBLY_ACC=CAM_ASM_000245 /LENGTH=114 /DNA_ID=CAMNT_0001774059 /DNA_START=83 /DNA_END=427 /DNA_ORIENTATION=-
MSFIRRFTFSLVPEKEYVFKKGEIAEEIFFIVDGKASVMDDDEVTVLVTLEQSAIFGEMGVIDLNPGTRSKSIKAFQDLTLAVLTLENFKDLVSQYPNVLGKIKEKVEERKRFN